MLRVMVCVTGSSVVVIPTYFLPCQSVVMVYKVRRAAIRWSGSARDWYFTPKSSTTSVKAMSRSAWRNNDGVLGHGW